MNDPDKMCDKENFCKKGIMLSSCEARIWVDKCPEFDSIDKYVKYIMTRRETLYNLQLKRRKKKDEI